MCKAEGFLTIVVPCYNGEAYIKRCTKSLEGLQEDISILFVNDGSTDSSRQMIEEWISIRPNASLISKPNGGYATAINCALDACRTEYVMFLGVDDEIVAEGIHKVVSHLKANSPDILAFTTVKKYDDSEAVCEKDPSTVYSADGYYETDLFSLYDERGQDVRILFTRDTSRCFKRSCIGDVRYFGKIGVSADGCFSMLVACKAKSFEFLNVDGYIWHLRTDSVSARKKTKKNLMDKLVVWSEFFSHMQNQYPDIPMPMPIVTYACIYGRTAYLLLKEEKEYARMHIKKAKEVSRWLLRHPLPLSRRLALKFPWAYNCWLQAKRKMAIIKNKL